MPLGTSRSALYCLSLCVLAPRLCSDEPSRGIWLWHSMTLDLDANALSAGAAKPYEDTRERLSRIDQKVAQTSEKLEASRFHATSSEVDIFWEVFGWVDDPQWRWHRASLTMRNGAAWALPQEDGLPQFDPSTLTFFESPIPADVCPACPACEPLALEDYAKLPDARQRSVRDECRDLNYVRPGLQLIVRTSALGPHYYLVEILDVIDDPDRGPNRHVRLRYSPL